MSNVQFSIEEVVPHKRTMCLLDRVLDYGPESLTAEVTITPNSVFATEQGVPAWIGIEYMAQAIAASAGVKRWEKGEGTKLGFLVGTRKYHCNTPYFPIGTRLTIAVEREFHADNGLGSFNCRIEGSNNAGTGNKANIDEGILVTCTLNVFEPEDAEAFLAGGAV